MRLRFLTLVLVMLAGHAMAQQTKSLQKVMQLKMQGDGGSNGAAIAFHTVNKKYYAAMAGNTTYPLCVFNEQGYLVSGGQVESLADVRGLWFNTRKAKLQGNAYGENGWFEYTLMETVSLPIIASSWKMLRNPTRKVWAPLLPSSTRYCFLMAVIFISTTSSAER